MIKIWESDDTSWATLTEAYFQDDSQVEELKFNFCESFKGKFPLVKILVSNSYPPADYFFCGSMKVISNKLLDVLDANPRVNAEFFPVEVIYRKKLYQERQFFCMNVLDEVDCFDSENSHYSLHKKYGFVCNLTSLALKPVDIQKHSLFYVALRSIRILCITEDLVDKILSQDCIGARFIEPKALKRP